MSLMNVLIKQIVLVGFVFYCLPGIWWTYNDMDQQFTTTADMTNHQEDQDDGDGNNSNGNADEDEYFLSVRFLMSTGGLLMIMGITYIMLPIDLIPDFIPILGGLDDKIATLIIGMGWMMTYLGYHFGYGEIPNEFDFFVTITTTIYNNYIMPIIQKYIIPTILPIMKSMLIPMKSIAKIMLGKVVDTVQDPTIQEFAKQTILNMMATTTMTGEGGEGEGSASGVESDL